MAGATQPSAPEGGGIDWGKLAQQYGPTIVSILSSLWGAHSQNQANAANASAINDRNKMLQGYIDPLLMQQQRQNPYAAALMQFIGRPGLGAPQGTAQNPYPIPQDWRKIRYDPVTGQYKQPAVVTTHDGQQVPIGPTTNAQGGYDAPQGYQASVAQSGMPVLYGADEPSPPPPEDQGSAADFYNAQVQDWTQRLGDENQARLIASQLTAQTYGDTSYFSQWDQANASQRQARIDAILADPNTDPTIRQLVQQPGYGTALNDYQVNSGQAPNPFASIFSQAQPAQPQAGGPARYLINGQEVFADGSPVPGGYNAQADVQSQYNTQGFGGMNLSPTSFGPGGTQLTFPGGLPTGTPDPTAPWTPTGTPLPGSGAPGTMPPLNPIGPSGTPGTGAGGMGTGGMYVYQSPGLDAFTYKPATLGPAPTVTGLQGMNAGQDALMQMMRSGGQTYGNATDGLFNNSDLFKALEPLDQRLIDRNVSQLRAGAGTLGARFGTAMAQKEANLREQLGQDVLARNAGIARDSFEAAQGRSLQAGLGLASSLGQSDTLNQQAKLANQGMLGQYGIQNANFLNQAGQFNAQQRQNENQFRAGQGNIYNQLMMSAFGQGAALDQTQFGNQANLISLLAGLPMASAQPSAYPGAVGDSAMLMMLLPYLQRRS